MKAIRDRAQLGAGNRVVLVLLPGAGIGAADFARQGFTGAVRARGWPVDVLAVDTPIERYVEDDFADRLHAAIVTPALAEDRAALWIAGISAGALGALHYAARYPARGLLLLSPFIGSRGLVAEVEAAGGIAAWARDPHAAPTLERRLLVRLGSCLPGEPAWPPLYLGYGTDDRFAAAHRLLAALLPAERVIAIPGAHDWPTWQTLWARLLDASRCGAAGGTDA